MVRYPLVLLILCLPLASAQGAEGDSALLTLEGDLIGLRDFEKDEVENASQAAAIVGAYYQLLPNQTLTEADSLYQQLLSLIPGFEVAYAAADSAEIAHVMSEIDSRLAAIQKIHAENYTQDVADLLTKAYQIILPTFGDKQ